MQTIKRLAQIVREVGLCRSSIYAKVKKGDFPAPISLGPRAIGWLSTDIENWINQRVAASRTTETSGDANE